MRISDWSSDVCSSDLAATTVPSPPSSSTAMISAPSWCGSASRRGGRAVGRSRTGATAHPDLGFDQGWPGFMMTERSEEHTSELQSLMRISYAVFCLKKKTTHNKNKMQSRRQ